MKHKTNIDSLLLFSVCSLLGLGLVMVTSSSVALADNQGLSFLKYASHQTLALCIGLVIAWIVTYLPLQFWQRISVPLLLGCMAFLAVILIPGVSHGVNGSTRWLFLGPISIQISEFAKLAIIIYIAGYLLRRDDEVRTQITGFIKPIMLLGVVAGLILLEPDFGAAVVIITTVMGMLYLGGVPFHRFISLFGLAVSSLIILSMTSPYRMARLTAFLDPWADQFNTGYQLTQSLIAFGRGGFFGMGLGNSVQKLLYLPEPHTDFLYAVLSEELGLMGALLVLLLLSILVWRIFSIGRRAVLAKQLFQGYSAYGIALWIGLQSLINIGVNVGVLPTKGLTLPLMSYGGCSLIVGLIALAIVFRVDYETKKLLK